MGAFYIQVEDNIWELDSTSSVTKNLSGSLSNSRVEDGSLSSDNYVTNAIRLSFSGVITDVKSLNIDPDSAANPNSKSTKEYLNQLELVYKNKIPFNISYSEDMPPLENCFFTSFGVTQDATNGTAYALDGYRSSYKVTFSVQQVRFATRAASATVPADTLKDVLSETKEKDSSTYDPCANLGEGRRACELELELTLLETAG